MTNVNAENLENINIDNLHLELGQIEKTLEILCNQTSGTPKKVAVTMSHDDMKTTLHDLNSRLHKIHKTPIDTKPIQKQINDTNTSIVHLTLNKKSVESRINEITTCDKNIDAARLLLEKTLTDALENGDSKCELDTDFVSELLQYVENIQSGKGFDKITNEYKQLSAIENELHKMREVVQVCEEKIVSNDDLVKKMTENELIKSNISQIEMMMDCYKYEKNREDINNANNKKQIIQDKIYAKKRKQYEDDLKIIEATEIVKQQCEDIANAILVREHQITQDKIVKKNQEKTQLEKDIVVIRKKCNELEGIMKYVKDTQDKKKQIDTLTKIIQDCEVNEKINDSIRIMNITKQLFEAQTRLRIGYNNRIYADNIAEKDAKLRKMKEADKMYTKKYDDQIRLLYELRSKLDKLTEYIGLKTDNDRIAKALLEFELAKKYAKMYRDMVSHNGLPLKCMNERLVHVIKDVNEFISESVGYEVSIDHKTLAFSAKKENKTLKISQLSGYEQFVLNLGVKQALNRYSCAPKCAFFAIDEGLDCIHAENLPKFFGLLNKMKSSYMNIALITHLEDAHSVSDQQINIFSNGKYSRLIMN